MNEEGRRRITLHAFTPAEVKQAARVIARIFSEQNSYVLQNPSARNNLPVKTYDFGHGITLTTNLLWSCRVVPVGTPVKLDDTGTACEADFLIDYNDVGT